MLTPRPQGSAPYETFTWTSAAPLGRAPQVVHDADRMAEAIDQACRELFPRRAGYQIDEERSHGVVRGRRYRISRRGFVGQVSVQLFTTGGAYRRRHTQPLQLRVVGRQRFQPPAPPPRFPTEALALGSTILLIAAILIMLGGHGWWAVAQHPSVSWFIDGLGFLGAATIVTLAGTAAVVMLREGAALPWAHLRAWLRWPVDPRADQRRWSALREHLVDRLPGLQTNPGPAPTT